MTSTADAPRCSAPGPLEPADRRSAYRSRRHASRGGATPPGEAASEQVESDHLRRSADGRNSDRGDAPTWPAGVRSVGTSETRRSVFGLGPPTGPARSTAMRRTLERG